MGVAAALALASGCLAPPAGPPPLKAVLRQAERATYARLLVESDNVPRDAFFKWKASLDGSKLDASALAAADAALTVDVLPFDPKSDLEAVRRGAVIYAAHCAGCHGENADGRGRDMAVVLPTMNMRSYSRRFAVANLSSVPAKWFKNVSDGKIARDLAPNGDPISMPPFRDIMAREQIWLALGYLMSPASIVDTAATGTE